MGEKEIRSNRAVRLWRLRLHMTQRQAAAKLGIGRTTVVNYEAGKRSDNGEPALVPHVVLLAANAVENNLGPITDKE